MQESPQVLDIGSVETLVPAPRLLPNQLKLTQFFWELSNHAIVLFGSVLSGNEAGLEFTQETVFECRMYCVFWFELAMQLRNHDHAAWDATVLRLDALVTAEYARCTNTRRERSEILQMAEERRRGYEDRFPNAAFLVRAFFQNLRHASNCELASADKRALLIGDIFAAFPLQVATWPIVMALKSAFDLIFEGINNYTELPAKEFDRALEVGRTRFSEVLLECGKEHRKD